jgi:hypothetical protein
LGALIYQTDSSTGERSTTINPDLPELLGRFAYYLDNPTNSPSFARGTLYDNIYKKWLFDYVVKDTSNPNKAAVFTIGGKDTYQLLPDRQSTADLFAKIRASFISLGDDSFHIYIGLYLFAAWFFLVDSVDTTIFPNFTDRVFSDRVRRYVATQCLDWKWTSWPPTEIKINPDWIRDSSTSQYTTNFLRQFKVYNFSLTTMKFTSNLRNTGAIFKVPPHLVTDFNKNAERNVDFEFITFFRKLLSNVLKEEFLHLSKEIGLGVAGLLGDFGLYAVGDGGTTLGFFGAPDFGLSFFDYDGDKSVKTAFYYTKRVREVTVWPGGGGPSSIFLVQWGANGTGSNVSVTVGTRTTPNAIGIKSATDAYLQSVAGAPDFTYDRSTGLLTFKNRTSEKIVFTYNSVGVDEIVFFTFGFGKLSTITTIPDPDPRLRIDYLFLDNEFAIPMSAVLAFWTAAPQETSLEALVLKMRGEPNFEIVSSISGGGIGVRVDMNGPDEFSSDLVPADDQTDNQVSNAVAFGNQGLRYAYGEALWTTRGGGAPGLLNLCTEGYASPLRCTWSTWAPFQLNTQPEFGGRRKADDLQTDIGDCLRPSLGLGPSYNTALSAFRAFGILEAMVRRLQDCADDLTPSQLTIAERDAIKDKLDVFLNTQARCVLLQVGLDRVAGVTIDYAMFRKYAY